ncbi:MAG TPA: hypothetical protein VFT00_03685, partial [Nocardioides sp.]|nr:hypothetical protein [Nocardioides sp.]
MSVRTPAHARSWRRRIGTALASLVAAAAMAIVPASPAHAIQTIAWTTAPPSTANLGGTVSFAWTGTANTFLGARITGCFANFPDGNNYVNQFQGNFTTGNCSYSNRVVTSSPTYPIVVGFTLSTGGQMTMSWNVSVANPAPTLVNVPAQVNLATTVAGGAVMPALSVYGTDQVYGNYAATCTPAAGTVIAYPGTTGTCSATNPAGRTATANFPINVAKGTPTVSWSLPSTVNYGTTYGSLQTATVTPNNLTGDWVYTDAQGAMVSPSAVIPVGSGQAVGATFVPTGASVTSWSTSPTALRNISVLQAPQTVAFAAGTPTSRTYGDPTFNVTATGTTGGGQVTITPQAGSTCTVGATSGTTTGTAPVTITGAGGCVLLANQTANGQFAAAPTAWWSVTVAKRSTTTTWSAPGPQTYGQTLASALNASSTAPGTIVYRTTAGAVVNASTVLDAGTHNLTATFSPTDLANYLGSSVSRSLVVNRAAPGLSVPAVADVTYGAAPLSLGATSDSPAPISVVASGACSAVGQQVTVLTAGTCALTVSQAATPNYDGASVTRSFEVAKATVDLAWSDPAPITYGTAFDPDLMGAAVAGANSPSGFLTYALANGDDATGAVLRAGDHDVTATWTPIAADASRYEVATRTATIHVDKATPTITWADPAEIPFLTALGNAQLDAQVDGVPGTIAYTLDNGDDAHGAALRAGSHRLTATFTPEDPDNVEVVTKHVWITVTRLAQEITWDLGDSHTLGDAPFELTASGGGSGNPVRFRTDSTSCSVDGNVVTLQHAGDCTVTASQDGSDDYWAAEPTSRSVTVAKAVPTITWDEPAGITYGDALGVDQLHATVSPEGATGTVAYTLADGEPADGAVLHAGDDQVLVATFTPDATSAGDYQSATSTVAIDVAKTGQAIDFAGLADATYGDGPVALDATGGGSGRPVTFTAVGDCTLDGGTVRIDGAGTCRVTADQAGDADHEAASSVARTFAIAKAPQHLALAPVADR